MIPPKTQSDPLCFMSFLNEPKIWAFKLLTRVGLKRKQEVVYDLKISRKESVLGQFYRLSGAACGQFSSLDDD